MHSLTDKENKNLDIKSLKTKKIFCINSENDMDLHIWNIYNCISCEMKIKNKLYLLNNGKWYEVEQNFVEKVI